MKTTITDSTSHGSSCDAETENLQSSSDSEDDDELFEDFLSTNTSPAKSDASTDSNPSSDDTYYSSLDIENTAIELDLLSISGDTSTGLTIDKKVENILNTAGLSPLHSSTSDEVNTKPVQENSKPSGTEMKIEILNVPDNAVGGAGNASSSNSKAAEMSDILSHNEQLPSDSSDSGWILVKSSARSKAQSRSKTMSVSQASARTTEIANSCFKSKSASQSHTKTTMKTPSKKKPRGKATAPRFTMRIPNTNASLRNPSHHRIVTAPSLPPPAIVRNPTKGACVRVSYSEALGHPISVERDVTTDLNPTAESSDRTSAHAFEIQDNDNANACISASLTVNAENQADDIAQTEQGKSNPESNLSSDKSSDCADLKASNSYRFNPAVGAPVRISDLSWNLKEEIQNDSLPILEGDDSFPDHFGSDFSNDSVLNVSSPSFPDADSLLGQVEIRFGALPGIEFTDKSLRTNVSSAPGRSDSSSDLPNLLSLKSDLIDFSKLSLFLYEANVNKSPTSEGASSSVRNISTESSNVSSTFRTEGSVLQPSSEVGKSYNSSCKSNDPTDILNKSEFFPPPNLESTEKSGIPKSPNISAACESLDSDNVSLLQQANNVLESQSITDDNISHRSVKNETHESVLNKNKSPSSPKKKNCRIKSQGTNIPSRGRTRNIASAKSTPQYPFQRTDNNSDKFTPMSNTSASSKTSSVNNTILPCTDDKVKAFRNIRIPFSSQSFSNSRTERPVLKNAFPHSSSERPILHSAYPHTSPERALVTSALSPGQFQRKSTQPPSPQQTGLYQHPPPRNFHQPFSQPHDNFIWSPYTSMGQPFSSVPSSFAFSSTMLFYQSTYPLRRVFIPQEYPRHFIAPQTNQPPTTQQTMHIPPVQYLNPRLGLPAAVQPTFNTQRPTNPSINDQAATSIQTNLQTINHYPNYLVHEQPSGRGLTSSTLRTQSGQAYSVSNWQFSDSESESDPEADDSSFTELSESEIKVLNRKDYNRYFRRLKRRKNRVALYASSVEKTSELPENTVNQLSAKEPQFFGVNLDSPSSKHMAKEGMNLNLPVSEEENDDVSGEEKQKRTRSVS